MAIDGGIVVPEKTVVDDETIKTNPTTLAIFSRNNLNTDASKSSIDLNLVLSGGPGKDGIPAINNPKFTNIINSNTHNETRGILFNSTDKTKSKFYPYSILVWHEIVNDVVDETPISITFCPLCDSGIVFDRRVDGEVLNFGVSGLLYESNLLMYDNETESLWSQALGESVVGHYTGTKLTILPLQVITFKELKAKYPDAQVLSTDTGFQRDYTNTPYSGYADSEDTYFPISFKDNRYNAKDPFFIIPISEYSFALQYREFDNGVKIFNTKIGEITIRRDGDEIFAMLDDGTNLPGYFEYWFSWATHHQENGIVLKNGK